MWGTYSMFRNKENGNERLMNSTRCYIGNAPPESSGKGKPE